MAMSLPPRVKRLLAKPLSPGHVAAQTVHVTNAGIVSGGKVTVRNYGDVTSRSTGGISSVGIDKRRRLYQRGGTTAAVSVDGGVFESNTGTVTGKRGPR